jgi:hypothetical protein
MKKWLIALAVIQMNTWIWSTVFHTRGKSPFVLLETDSQMSH